jgi:hypothetical protein
MESDAEGKMIFV